MQYVFRVSDGRNDVDYFALRASLLFIACKTVLQYGHDGTVAPLYYNVYYVKQLSTDRYTRFCTRYVSTSDGPNRNVGF